MADYRYYSKNKNYMNQNSQNGLLLLIICSMALIFESYGRTLETESNNDGCSNALTCTKCAIKDDCAWSLKNQMCTKQSFFDPPNLMIYNENRCPRFSVVTKYTYSDTHNNLLYTVKVSNDHVGFMNYLKESIFFCNSTTIDVYKKRINNDEIECSATILRNNFKLYDMQSITALIYIKFNGVLLLLDNIADYYVTFYERECAKYENNEYCETCTWNDNKFAHYVRLCSSKNSCEGHNELYMWHNGIGRSWHSKTQKVKDQCARIKVRDVNPLSGTMAGGTTIKITVINHAIFANNRNVTVTVAGTACVNISSTQYTITCITTPPADDDYELPSGPVLVTYTSPKGELKIESSQMFQFCFNPVLDEGQLLKSIVSGGISVPIRGGHFVEPCVVYSARLYVDLPDGVRSYAKDYCDPPVNDTYMVCQSPEVRGVGLNGDAPVVRRLLNFGLDVTSQQTVVTGPPLRFNVYPDPVLLDFIIDENDLVVINGSYLQHVLQDDIVVRSVGSPSKVCEVVLVTRYSLVCKPVISATAWQNISVTLGSSLKYTVIRRTLPQIDDSSILFDRLPLIMLLPLMFFYIITIGLSLKRKNCMKVNTSTTYNRVAI